MDQSKQHEIIQTRYRFCPPSTTYSCLFDLIFVLLCLRMLILSQLCVSQKPNPSRLMEAAAKGGDVWNSKTYDTFEFESVFVRSSKKICFFFWGQVYICLLSGLKDWIGTCQTDSFILCLQPGASNKNGRLDPSRKTAITHFNFVRGTFFEGYTVSHCQTIRLAKLEDTRLV